MHFNRLIIVPILLMAITDSGANQESLPAFVEQQLQHSMQKYQSYKLKILNRSGNPFVSIGNDSFCDVDINITNIQMVIESGATEIRLANNAVYNEDLFITNRNIDIRGGFENCEDANNNLQGNNKTLITGTNTAPVIIINGSSETHEVSLQNLDIRNGKFSDFFSGGGISTLSADLSLFLVNVNISNNTGSFGGGIALNNGSTSLTMIDTNIQFNTALQGGGIHCMGSDINIAIFGKSGIIENESTSIFDGGGGGMFLTDGCKTSIYSGSSTQSNIYGISNNISASNGGGIYMKDGAKLNLFGQEFCFLGLCLGDATQPVNITNNSANDSTPLDFYGLGGGIYAFGFQSETEIFMNGALINNNHAEIGGAGINIQSANLTIKRSAGKCWDNTRCNFFQGNQAHNFDDDSTFGGAIYNSGTVEIESTYFEDNRADTGTAIYTQNNTNLTISNSVFNHNGNFGIGGFKDEFVIGLNQLSNLTIEYSTFADNNANLAVIGRYLLSAHQISVYSSIFNDSNTGLVFDGFLKNTLKCIIAHEIDSMSTGENIHVNNPQFIDSANRDYHLNASISPAVDLCEASNVLGNNKDIDQQSRGWDDYTVTNHLNNPNMIYDAGADETYDNDIIFKNDFD